MKAIVSTLAFMLLVTSAAAQDVNSEHAIKTLEIYTRIIGMETSKGLGNVPIMAEYLASELIEAGLPEEDVEVVPVDDTAVLIARYRGNGTSGKAPGAFAQQLDGTPALGVSERREGTVQPVAQSSRVRVVKPPASSHSSVDIFLFVTLTVQM